MNTSSKTTPTSNQCEHDRFLGVKQIREMFSTTDRHIRRWVSCGKFPKPALKIGRMLRWSVADVEKFIEEHRLT